MKRIFLVIFSCGDGSSSIEFYKDVTIEQLRELEKSDPERYSGGDGLQVKTLDFPDDFDLDQFAKVNHIYWSDDDNFEKDDWDKYDEEVSFD